MVSRRMATTCCALDRDLYFEGAGDLLGFPDAGSAAIGSGSDIRVFPLLSEWFQREIIPLELIDSSVLSSGYVFLPAERRRVAVLSLGVRCVRAKAIADRIRRSARLVVPEVEALRFACNAVCVGKHVVLPSGCPATMRLLESRGYRSHAVPLDQFMKSGGSAKCLTLALD